MFSEWDNNESLYTYIKWRIYIGRFFFGTVLSPKCFVSVNYFNTYNTWGNLSMSPFIGDTEKLNNVP